MLMTGRSASQAVRIAAIGFACVILLAGCLEPSSPAPADPEATAPDDEQRTARPGDRGGDEEEEEKPRTLLGRASGGPTTEGRIPFTVTVPEGGATDVEWGLVVEPVGAIDFNQVEGPGCSGGGSVTAVGSYTQTDGTCSDLEAGDHEFAIVLLHPVVSYDAQVLGVLADSPSDSSSNATER